MTIGDRIKLVRNRYSINQDELGKVMGLTKSAISSMELNKNQPTVDFALKLKQYYQISIDWLLSGDGDPIEENTDFWNENGEENTEGKLDIPSKEERVQSVPITVPFSVPKTKREKQNELLIRDLKNEFFTGKPNIRAFSVKAQGGALGSLISHDYIDELPAFHSPLPILARGEFVAFEIEGESMAPTVCASDWVICHQIRGIDEISKRFLHVIGTKESLLLKRIGAINNKKHILTLNSDNPEFDPIDVPYDDILQLWRVDAKQTTIGPLV